MRKKALVRCGGLVSFWMLVFPVASSTATTAPSLLPTWSRPAAATTTAKPPFFTIRPRRSRDVTNGTSNDDMSLFTPRTVEEPDGIIDRDEMESSSTKQWTKKFWPPWPFTMLPLSSSKENDDDNNKDVVGSPGADSIVAKKKQQQQQRQVDYSALAHFWSISKQSAKVAARNVQEVGSQLWYHLPPGAPPLLLLASWPQRQHQQQLTDAVAVTAAAGAAAATDAVPTITKTVIPLISNPFVRSVAFSAAGLAFVSWGHAELRRKRRLTALPLNERYRDINSAILPPFLPEAVTAPMSYIPPDSLLENHRDDGGATLVYDDEEEEVLQQQQQETMFLPPRLRRYWKELVGNNVPKRRSLRTGWRELRQKRLVRQCERRNAHRLAVYDELATLQALRNKTVRRNKTSSTTAGATAGTSGGDGGGNNAELGYALVTGASKGIGRALAVELARWEIPLILVARDADALAALASDLETCYGIHCYVVPSDLAHDGTAQKLYRTVKNAGLKVDFLINNAGIASHGDVLDNSLADLDKIVQVNTRSLLALTHLFGRDMRDQRRGRVLMVSSVCGAVSGIASVAVYSATKAFANSFGIALAKEMEPYGVGVTCLLPGAVKGTDFRAQSQSHEALCWKLPFYCKSAAAVAEAGVRAMLHGDVEVTPGIINRLYLKVAKPIAPQRLHNLMAEIMWKPVVVPQWLSIRSGVVRNGTSSHHVEAMEVPSPVDTMRTKPLQVRPAGVVYKGLPKSRILELEMPPAPDRTPAPPATNELEIDSLDLATTSVDVNEMQMNHGLGNQTEFTAPSSAVVIQDHSAAIEPITKDMDNSQNPVEPASSSDATIIQAQKADETLSLATQDQPQDQDIDFKHILEKEHMQRKQEPVTKKLPTAPDASTLTSSGGGFHESTIKTDPALPLKETDSSDNTTSELELLLNQYQRQRSTTIEDPIEDALGFSLLTLPDWRS